MSRKGNCRDNAVAESFFSSLKKERLKKQIYKKRELALNDVADDIDRFYNRTRRHSHLGGVSPEQFEAAQERGDGVTTKSSGGAAGRLPLSNIRSICVIGVICGSNLSV
jgi:hypothetical protein